MFCLRGRATLGQKLHEEGTVSRNAIDGDERILHYAMTVGIPFSVQAAATKTNLREATAARIVSKYEDLEVFRRCPINGPQMFEYAPTTRGLALKAVKRQLGLEQVMVAERKRHARRELDYADSR